MPNVGIIARREYGGLVRSRLFFVSTLVLTGLAMFVALLPIVAKLVDRESRTTVAVVASDPELLDRSMAVLQGLLDQTGGGFDLVVIGDEQEAITRVADREFDAAIVAVRRPTGQLGFSFHLGETMGQQQITNLTVGVFGVAVVDYVAQNPASSFQQPAVDVFRALGDGNGGSQPFDASAFASRLIVGAVFGFLIFITIVIYGMWVAQGVVAEKSSRVMELLISAASTRQLVIGKALGIGLAGATQTAIVLAPALLVLVVEDALARLVLGQGVGLGSSISSLSPGLLFAFAGFYVLGLRALLAHLRGRRVARQPP